MKYTNQVGNSLQRLPILLVATAIACSPVFARGGGGSHSGGSHSSSSHTNGEAHNVKDYTKRDGTSVESHRQTNPNGTKNDNWSTQGNVNPDTGKAGTKPRD